MSMTTTSGTVLNGLYVGSSTPVANQKGLLIDNKYFIPLVESSSPGTDTSDATATASDILQDKTAYVNGEKITGTISSYTGSSLIIPGVEDKVLSTAEGIYLPKAVKVAGESDLLAENIKKGVSIFGIVGTLESSGGTSAEYYKCASVSSGTGAVLEGRLMTMSFIDIIDFDYATEPTVIHFTMTDTTKTGLDREWVSSDGVYTFKKYVNTAEGYISWGLYKNSDNTYSHYITTGLIDQNKVTTDAEGNTVDMRDPWEIKQLYSEAGFMDTKEISWGHSQEAVGGKTWSGYKAIFDSSTGTWSFESNVTEGLTYTSVTPVVGGIYSADALARIQSLYQGEPSGLIFHAPLASDLVDIVGGIQGESWGTAPVYGQIDGKYCVTTNSTGIKFAFDSAGLFENIWSPRTIMLWFRNTSGSGWRQIFSPSDNMNIRCANMTVNYGLYERGEATQAISSNIWYHHAFTVTENNIKWYIDGVLKTNNTSWTPAALLTYFTLATWTGTVGDSVGGAWYGQFADVRIYNRVLEAAEIQQIYEA